MNFIMNFSWKITVTAFLFALGMCGMSYWQWTRYLEKEKFLKVLDSRLHAEIAPLSHYIPALKSNPESVQHYRVLLQGEWDFDHEIIKRNRRDDSDGPGVHIITPLRLPESNEAVLVDRGYIPLSMQDQEKRSIFRQNAPKSFVGLLKVTEKPRSWFSPNDPPSGKPHPWVDRWLRIDIDKIQKQVPYEL
ncbi:MAG: SURF1 family protein, partial [Bdellovibrionales bacterium]|nr:SURF1 family protein [Bdellovibrionales bacterium]